MSLQYTKSSTVQTVTLGSSYTAGSGTMTLTGGNGAYLPASGDFWLSYNNGSGTIRIFKVTARSTDTLTVTAVSGEGSGDGNISSGETLRWALSVDALDQLKADIKASTGLVLLETKTASASASLAFTTSITSTYNNYLVVLEDLLPATNGVDLLLQVSTDGGSTYLATNYTGGYWVWSSGGGGAGSTGTTSFKLATSQSNNSSNRRVNGTIEIHNPLGTSNYKDIYSRISGYDGSSQYTYLSTGTNTVTTAINAFKIYFSSGNITSGTAYCYGIAKS